MWVFNFSILGLLSISGVNIQWEGKDLEGNAHRIPSPKASVLVFAIPDLPISAEGVVKAREILRESSDLQVLLIVSGEVSPAQATSVCGACGWPIVIDKDYSTSSQFKVSAWPGFVILSGEGEQIGKIAGLPASMPSHFTSYLDFVRGKIDRPTLEQLLSASDVAHESGPAVARPLMTLAVDMLEKGDIEQARLQLDKALQADPKSTDVQFVQARVLLAENKAEETLKVLDTLVKDLPAFQINALKGEALVALKRWPEALSALEASAPLNPKAAEVYYELGVVNENLGNWKPASESFRRAFESTAEGKKLKNYLPSGK